MFFLFIRKLLFFKCELVFCCQVFIDKEAGAQKVRAYGPGLEGGKVGKSADFVVETTGNDVGQLGE